MDRNHFSRRRLLGSAGVSIGALVATNTVTAAKNTPGRSGKPDSEIDWIGVDEGKFVLDIDPNELRDDLYEEWEDVVESFNDAIESGQIRVKEAGSQTKKTPKKGRSGHVLEFRDSPAEIARSARSKKGRGDR